MLDVILTAIHGFVGQMVIAIQLRGPNDPVFRRLWAGAPFERWIGRVEKPALARTRPIGFSSGVFHHR
jgi:hypothetical protein